MATAQAFALQALTVLILFAVAAPNLPSVENGSLGTPPRCGSHSPASEERQASGLTGLATASESAGHSVTWDDNFPEYKRFYVNNPFGNRQEFLEPDPR